MENDLVRKGVVVKSTGSFYLVRMDDGEILTCHIRGKLRLKGIRTTNPVAVGDVVDVQENTDGCIISAITERKNYLIRKSTNLSKEAHILAANVDQAFMIATLCYPDTSTVFIDRFLAACEAYNIPAGILFNKIDLYDEHHLSELNELKEIYESMGYPCYVLSAEKNINIDLLDNLLKGKVTVFSGLSGVGKSTLLNKIDPELNLKTGDISTSHQTGKHTTTFAEMFSLKNGGYVIDTPGIRSFGMIDMKKDEIYHFFREIFEYSHRCKFNNCTHLHEPGCAVIEAVQSGEISPRRYFSYLSLMEEDGEKYR